MLFFPQYFGNLSIDSMEIMEAILARIPGKKYLLFVENWRGKSIIHAPKILRQNPFQVLFEGRDWVIVRLKKTA